MMIRPILAIVLPCYNEEEVLPMTAEKINELLDDMIRSGEIASDSFACFVDDGSRDETWNIVQKLSIRDPIRFRSVKLVRNYGHQRYTKSLVDFSIWLCVPFIRYIS